MVDVIHSNAGVAGVVIDSGTVDFWPNGGFVQPGCSPTNPWCNHRRSWKYFSESVASSNRTFFAVECESYIQFEKFRSSCKNSSMNNMGIDANQK